MSHELQSTLEASGIQWPALRNHIPCMAHSIQLALNTFMSRLGVKGCTKFWEAYKRDQQIGDNESIEIGKSQRLRQVGNARINKVRAMRPGLAKIIETVRISRYFESPETDLDIAENACCIDHADTWLSKQVHWLLKPKVHITVLHIMAVRTCWNSTLEWHEWAYRVWESTHKWLQNSKYTDFQPLLKTQDERTIVNRVMDDVRPFRYWILSISKRHTVTLHHIIAVYNDLFNHMDGVMRALARKKTQWKEHLFFAVKLARQKLS